MASDAIEERAMELFAEAYPGTTVEAWEWAEPWVQDGYRERAEAELAAGPRGDARG